MNEGKDDVGLKIINTLMALSVIYLVVVFGTLFLGAILLYGPGVIAFISSKLNISQSFVWGAVLIAIIILGIYQAINMYFKRNYTL